MNVIITGSTKGLGLALAKRVLEADHRVLICSRTGTRVDDVVAQLEDQYPGQVIGTTVDTTKYESVEKLAQFALQHWEGVDIWINNAGTTAPEKHNLYDHNPEIIKQIIDTNLTGTMYGCKVAVALGRQHPIHIFNVDGLGSDGRIMQYHSIYGSSKRAIPYLSQAIDNELQKDSSLDHHIGMHTMSPGMVLTDLLIKKTAKEDRGIFNILAETPDNVAEYLIPKVLTVAKTTKSGVYIKFLTRLRIVGRFLTFWRYKNRYFDTEGNLVVNIDGITFD